LLRGRLPGVGSARARLVRVRLEGRERTAPHQGWRDAHARADQSGRAEIAMGLRGLGRWFDERLQLAKPVKAVLAHPVPRQTASWFYVFGSAALALFVLQLVTGILLALIYVPSAGEAWNVLQVLNRDVPAGW